MTTTMAAASFWMSATHGAFLLLLIIASLLQHCDCALEAQSVLRENGRRVQEGERCCAPTAMDPANATLCLVSRVTEENILKLGKRYTNW